MIKVLSWFRRRPDLSPADFLRHWHDEHPKVVLAAPGLRSYTQNPVADTGSGRRPTFCDGVAETWWDDLDALRALRGTDELAAVRADEDRFVDPDHRFDLVTTDVVVVDGTPAPGALKQFTWLRHRPDLGVEAAQAHWRGQHARIASRVPGLVRYVQCHTLPELYGRGRDPSHMGIPISWMDDLETARAAASSPELAATRADEVHFLDGSPLPFVLTSERVVAPPSGAW